MNRNPQRGFSLIELLTVIAIIAMLAAILYPVMNSVKGRARRGQCMSNLREISSALRQFKMDENNCPPFLLYKPIDSKGALGPWSGIYPYLPTLSRYHCPDSANALPDSTGAVPPNSTSVLSYPDKSPGTATLYYFDSYDGMMDAPGNTYHAHYNPFRKWASDYTQAPPSDYVRQLRWRKPPSDTVVTWCGFHRVTPGLVADPKGKGTEIFLWYDGHVQAVDDRQVGERLKAYAATQYDLAAKQPDTDMAGESDYWWRLPQSL